MPLYTEAAQADIPWGSLLSVAIWLSILILITGLFVAGEYSFVLSRKTRMTSLAEQGNIAAKRVLAVLADPQQYLAGIQIGITLTSLALGAFTEEPLRKFFEALLGRVSAPWLAAAAPVIGSVVSLAVASYFQVILGELLPRAITLNAAERVALLLVPPLSAFTQLLRPFTWTLTKSSQLVARMFGLKSTGDELGRLHSADEIRMLVEESERGGLIETDQGDLLDKVFSFGDTTVREVMIPRTEMICVAVNATLPAIAHEFSQHAYSRLPVYEDSLDHIVGILHIKDMMRVMLAADRTRQPQLRQLLREPYFVPDSQKADELLAGFRKKREYMAVVLDEYGGTAGLVTLNDLVTRLIGEVGDAAQPSAPDILHGPDGSAIISGLTMIGDVNDAFGLTLSDKNYDTVGGYVMGQLGRIPRTGDVIDLPQSRLQLRVEEMDKLRVAKLLLRQVEH
jgi:CBS domain containing-hemolysin-like protein